VWHRTVAARATDQDADLVGVGEERPIANADQANVEVVPEVKAEDGVGGGLTKDAIIEHRWRTAGDLLGRLKDKEDVAGERCALATQQPSNRQEDRDVAIVATGVHHPSVPRGVGNLVLFLDRQGVDVGPERDQASAGATAEAADYAGLTNALTNLDPKGAQRFGNTGGRAALLKGELRISM